MALLHVSSVALVWMFPLVANVWLSTPEPIQVCVFVLTRASWPLSPVLYYSQIPKILF